MACATYISNSAIAANLNIRAQKGDTFERVFKFWTDETKTIPVDITTLQFVVNVVNSGLVFIPVITAPNILTISQPAANMDISGTGINWNIPANGYGSNVPSVSYNWNIKETSGSDVLTIISGIFQIVDGDGCSDSSTTDIIINEGDQTIEVIANIIGGGSSDDPSVMTTIAGQDLSGGRVVIIKNAQAIYFDPSDVTMARPTTGITLTSALTGSAVQIKLFGIFTETGFGLTPDSYYFAGVNGIPTTSIAGLKVIQPIGSSISNNSLNVNINSQIITI